MDFETIQRKYSYLIKKFKELKEILNEFEIKKFKNEFEKQIYISALERQYEQVVETTIKLNIYILKENKAFPKTYKESFILLKEILKYNNHEIEEISKTAKFRNILAHEYQELKQEDILDNIKLVIKTYPKYVKQLKKELDKVKNE